VAHHIREIFVDRIGASERHTVALIAGGHSLGRCHPEISGYAGPWQSNPGYFNNVYCKKLLSEDWKIVDRNMEDCSGDLITGLKPYGMRRQYVNKAGKGDLMMLVSDMALKEDLVFGYWIQEYAHNNKKLKEDFGVAFKWITELGFEPPPPKQGFQKLLFKLRKCKADALRWLGDNLCGVDDAGVDETGAGSAKSSAPKIGDPYTLEEVKAHNKDNDCWVAINGKVCDLTEFMAVHPGGKAVIMGVAGKDASGDWNAIHNVNAIESIAPHVVIGHVVAKKDGA
jgi:predicted heme/steroid binding protein